jgi:SAM-dependent methyltransferase
MPVSQVGKTVFDYGCGPGHDTLLFCLNGAGHVFYYDISPLALEIVDMRLDLHGVADHASPTDLFWLPPVDQSTAPASSTTPKTRCKSCGCSVAF